MDTDVIAKAPARLLVSGMGDALATWFEARATAASNSGTCAGGTGAFLDQMSLLLNTDVTGLNELAKNYKNIY